jgi:hypothetical protein
LAVKAARVEIAGGEVAADPFTVGLSPFSVKVRLRMTRVGLQDVVALVPTMLSDAREVNRCGHAVGSTTFINGQVHATRWTNSPCD